MLDSSASLSTFAIASGTSWPSKAGSANRAGSGHGGSGETPDVRHPQGGRTKNAPEDETDLMPQIGFLFSTLLRDNSNHEISRIMSAITKLPGIRVREENLNHHLWNNHGTWFLHYTVHPTPFTKERIRRSLGTKDVNVARERRDAFFVQLANEAAKVATARKDAAA
jgi:hypothetical protein